MSITGLVFVAVFFFGIFKALASRPIFGLYTYLLTYYLHAPANWWGKGLPDLRWSLFAALVTFISLFIHQKKYPIVWFKYRETKIFAIFACWVLLQSLWAIKFSVHKEYVFLSIKFVLLIIIIQSCLRDAKDIKGFVIANMIGCAYFGYIGFSMGGRLENVGTADLENSNQLAQHMGAILMMGAFLLLMPFKKAQLVLYVMVILILNGIIQCESRSVIFALAGSGFLAVVFGVKETKKKQFVFSVLAGIAFIVLLGPGLANKMRTVVADDQGAVEQDSSAASRIVIIKAQWKMFLSRPVQGSGHRGTMLLSPYYMDKALSTVKGDDGLAVRSSHNFIMTLLVDHGLIGAALYMAVIFMCGMGLLKLKNYSAINDEALQLKLIALGAILALVVVMIAGLGSNNKKLEIDIWLYALIPLIFDYLKTAATNKRESISPKPSNFAKE